MNKFNRITQTQYLLDGVDKYCSYTEIKLPRRATSGSAGYDIFSVADFDLAPGETIKLPTGIQVHLDEDKFLAIVPRSGLGFKYRTQLWNTVGVIDSDYHRSDNEGHIWVKMINESSNILHINKGDAICQGIIMQYFKTDDDTSDGIRNGGFGSTSKLK